MAAFKPRQPGNPMNRYDECLQSARHYKDQARYWLQQARNAYTTRGRAMSLSRAHTARIHAAACLIYARTYHPIILPH